MFTHTHTQTQHTHAHTHTHTCQLEMKLSEGFETLKDCDSYLDLLGNFSFFLSPPKKNVSAVEPNVKLLCSCPCLEQMNAYVIESKSTRSSIHSPKTAFI